MFNSLNQSIQLLFCCQIPHNNVLFTCIKIREIFRLCTPPPSLVGAYYLHPADARSIFLHDDLLCNSTCSVTEGRITSEGGGGGGGGGGAQKEKIPIFDAC